MGYEETEERIYPNPSAAYPETEERFYPNPEGWRIIADGRALHEDLHHRVVVLQERRRRSPVSLKASADVARFLRTAVDLDREAFYVLPIDPKRRLLGLYVASLGGQTFAAVDAAVAFRVPVILGAKAVIFVHNHPSGVSQPSAEDVSLTERLRRAGRFAGVSVVDHVVLGVDEHFSFLEAGLLSKEDVVGNAGRAARPRRVDALEPNPLPYAEGYEPLLGGARAYELRTGLAYDYGLPPKVARLKASVTIVASTTVLKIVDDLKSYLAGSDGALLCLDSKNRPLSLVRFRGLKEDEELLPTVTGRAVPTGPLLPVRLAMAGGAIGVIAIRFGHWWSTYEAAAGVLQKALHLCNTHVLDVIGFPSLEEPAAYHSMLDRGQLERGLPSRLLF